MKKAYADGVFLKGKLINLKSIIIIIIIILQYKIVLSFF